jgi:hypothetical protein
MLRQYYWCWDFYSTNRWSEKTTKIHKNIIIGAMNAPRFAYKCKAQRSTNDISCVFYIAPVLLALSRSHRFTCYFRPRL